MGLTPLTPLTQLTSRRRTRAVLAGLAAVCLLAAVDAALLWRAQQRNAAIASGKLPADTRGSPQADDIRRPPPEGGEQTWGGPAFAHELPAEMRFAQAAALLAGGADEAALNAFTALQSDTPLGQAARYNTANLLLRQATRVRGGAQPGQAIPLVELAKETLRDVLRHDPAFWDARYNLERAQRLLADPEEGDSQPEGPQRNAERAATTMRSFSPGLP
jgi:mxaK protein